MNGGTNPGPPEGNRNAWKHGGHAAEAMALWRAANRLMAAIREPQHIAATPISHFNTKCFENLRSDRAGSLQSIVGLHLDQGRARLGADLTV